LTVLLGTTGCEKYIDSINENKSLTGATDYSISSNMILPLIGTYSEFNNTEWENFPLIAVRGDDVNAGGLGDQQDYAETDNFNYNKDYWMYNSLFQNYYTNMFSANSSIEQVELYLEAGANQAIGSQYIGEIKVLKAWWLFNLSRMWGSLPIPTKSSPSELFVAPLSTKDEIMQMISDMMDEAIPVLPAVRPNERTDIPGGVTKYNCTGYESTCQPGIEELSGCCRSHGRNHQFWQVYTSSQTTMNCLKSKVNSTTRTSSRCSILTLDRDQAIILPIFLLSLAHRDGLLLLQAQAMVGDSLNPA